MGSGTPVINPIPIGQTASYTRAQQLSAYTQLEQFPEYLAGLQTQFVYIDPNNNMFHLNGPLAGLEGVRLGEQLQGEHHVPFEQVLLESAFLNGAIWQRSNVNKREINFRITIGGPGMNNYTYRMCEQRWWAGQDINNPGWLGCFTRLSGWRWLPVLPYKTIDTSIKQDPVAYGNNFATWDINWLAPWPYWSKPARFGQWKASKAGAAHSDGYYYGNIVLANAGDANYGTPMQYLVSGAGFCQLQDNNADTLITLPQIFASDGIVLVQTDPAEQTLTAQNDPQDTPFYEIARASGILNFFLTGAAAAGEPIWQRGYVRFQNAIPTATVTHFTVAHTNPNATITALIPQFFQRAR
jgi:hypothetical protein